MRHGLFSLHHQRSRYRSEQRLWLRRDVERCRSAGCDSAAERHFARRSSDQGQRGEAEDSGRRRRRWWPWRLRRRWRRARPLVSANRNARCRVTKRNAAAMRRFFYVQRTNRAVPRRILSTSIVAVTDADRQSALYITSSRALALAPRRAWHASCSPSVETLYRLAEERWKFECSLRRRRRGIPTRTTSASTPTRIRSTIRSCWRPSSA